jgi:large subunit ribosomal protein L30e
MAVMVMVMIEMSRGGIVMVSILDRIIRQAIEMNAYRIGTREVMKNISNAKLIVCSRSLRKDVLESIDNHAKNSNIPVYNINKNSMELGRVVGKPFRVSVISIEQVDDELLKELVKG